MAEMYSRVEGMERGDPEPTVIEARVGICIGLFCFRKQLHGFQIKGTGLAATLGVIESPSHLDKTV